MDNAIQGFLASADIIICKRMRVPQGFWGNKGTREIRQWEHGNKAKKLQGTRVHQIG